MMRPMHTLLKSLLSSICFSGVLWANVPYEIHQVKLSPIYLPSKLETVSGKVLEVKPSVWNQKTLKFSAGMPQRVIVRRGDNLKTISERYAVPIRNIIEVNHLNAPFRLREGDVLTLFGPRIHIAAEGDDLYRIAELHDVSLSALTRQNKIKHPFKIKPGQKLILPASPIKKAIKKTAPLPHEKPALFPKISKHKEIGSAQLLKKLKRLPQNANLKFTKPVSGVIVSGFGPKGGGMYNDGINIKGPAGAKIISAEDGVVVYTGHDIKSYGNLVLIKHVRGWITAYAHMDQIHVKKGQRVKKRQSIGTIGKTGFVTCPQLHFETRLQGKPQNPALYI